jgi:hypothetical protein
VARRVNDFQFGVRQGKPKYPWKQWTNREIWEVVHGKDFDCTPGSLVVYLYHKAGTLGLNVRTSIQRGEGKKPDRVVFQFWKREEEPVTKKYKKLKRRRVIHGRREDQGGNRR